MKSKTRMQFIPATLFFGLLLVCEVASASSIRDRAAFSVQKLSSDSGEKTLIEAWVSDRWLLDEEGSSILQVGIQARNTDLALSQNGLPNQLWMVVPQANLLKSLTDSYSLIANLRVGAFGDFQNFSKDDFRVEGAVVLDKIVNNRFTWGLGVGRVSNFGRVLFIPVLHLLWTLSDQWLLDAFLPGKFELLYLPSSRSELGVAFNIVGSRYRLGEATSNIDSVGVGQMNFGPVFRHQIRPSLYFSAEVGAAFARRLSLMDGNTEVVRFNPDTEGYARAGIQYRF